MTPGLNPSEPTCPTSFCPRSKPRHVARTWNVHLWRRTTIFYTCSIDSDSLVEWPPFLAAMHTQTAIGLRNSEPPSPTRKTLPTSTTYLDLHTRAIDTAFGRHSMAFFDQSDCLVFTYRSLYCFGKLTALYLPRVSYHIIPTTSNGIR